MEGLKGLEGMKGLEGLKNLQKYGKPEDKNERDKSVLFSACIQFPIAIAMAVVGGVYINYCKYSQAALFLQIYGGLVMGTSSLKIWAYFFKNKMDFVDKIVPGLELAEFIVTIWGSIVVFSKLSFSI